jgi:hypothetical protein
MSELRSLMEQITALRQRLMQLQAEAGKTDSTPSLTALLAETVGSASPSSGESVGPTQRTQALVDHAIGRLADSLSAVEGSLPTALTSRVRALLERGRQIVALLRAMADSPELSATYTTPAPGVAESSEDELDPLAAAFRETAAMTETCLRLVQAFPNSPTAQLRLADGLECIIDLIEQRVAGLAHALRLRRVQTDRVGLLATQLANLDQGRSVDVVALQALAEQIWQDTLNDAPLRLLHTRPESADVDQPAPARFIACRALTVAQLVATLSRQDIQLQQIVADAILAALLHDVGLMRVPLSVLAASGPLDANGRIALEAHPRTGAQLISEHLPSLARLATPILCHHERPDGSGYPSGLRSSQLPLLARMLMVADCYTDLVTPTPHRPGCDPRTALTDTLLLAERGQLDPNLAERLLGLSFYPVGSVVELSDGQVGQVVTARIDKHDLNSPSRPVVSILMNERGELVHTPVFIDLLNAHGLSIRRVLPAGHRRRFLGRRYPHLAV